MGKAFVLLWLGLQAHAIVPNPIVDQGGFYSREELPIRPRHLDRALASTVRMGQCSGVIVSPKGYLVTNIHCITECLEKKWDYTPDIAQLIGEKPGAYKFRRIFENNPRKLACPAWIRQQFHIYSYQLSDPEFVWMGNGHQNHQEPRIGELNSQELQMLREATEDVVILKYRKHPQYPNIPCLPTTNRRIKPDELVWAVGWPAWTERKNGRGSDGSKIKISVGRVRSSIEQDPIYQGYVADMSPEQQSTFWSREKQIWHQPHLLMTNLDVYGGNSGGVMLNAAGEAQAIVFTISKSSQERYTGGTAFGFRTDALKRRVEEDLGVGAANEIFNCY